MSNWRINVGVGPLRYVRALGGGTAKKGKKPGCLGSVITLVVVAAVMYLCCWGGVAWTNGQQ